MPAAAAVRPPQEDKYLKDLVAELHLWSRMHHPNICQFLGAVTRARESVLLVADYCERGSLHRVLMGHLRERSKMPFATRMRYARGIACGMAYLHRQRIPAAGPARPGAVAAAAGRAQGGCRRGAAQPPPARKPRGAPVRSRTPQKVCHRDLKPANCLIDGGDCIKARLRRRRRRRRFCAPGAPPPARPEPQ